MGNCWPRTATAGCPAAPKPANRPALRASFIPPAAGVIPKEVEGRVHFLIDTGADTTILHPDDGIDLRCPFDALANPAEFVGVGSTLRYSTIWNRPSLPSAKAPMPRNLTGQFP